MSLDYDIKWKADIFFLLSQASILELRCPDDQRQPSRRRKDRVREEGCTGKLDWEGGRSTSQQNVKEAEINQKCENEMAYHGEMEKGKRGREAVGERWHEWALKRKSAAF